MKREEVLLYENIKDGIKEDIYTSLNGCRDEEANSVKIITNKARRKIEEMLEDSYKYSTQDVEEILTEAFEEFNVENLRFIDKTRQDMAEESTYFITNMSVKQVENLESIQEKEQKQEEINNTFGRMFAYSGDILNEKLFESKRVYGNSIEDMVLTELKSKIKRKMDPYSSKVSEEAFYDVSRILTNDLLFRLQDEFESNSNILNSTIMKKLEERIEGLGHEYKIMIDKEIQEEVNKNEKSEFLQSLPVKSEDEVAEDDIKRLSDNSKEEPDKGEKLITSVIE